MAFRPTPLRSVALLLGASTLLASATLLLVHEAEPEPAPRLASAGEAPGPAAWTPAPLLALLIVSAMSALVLAVTIKPRRG